MTAKEQKYDFVDEVSLAKRLESINSLIYKGKRESIIKFLKKENIDIEIIKTITGLTLEEISKLPPDDAKL